MKYRPTWDLSTIPDDIFQSERQRRVSAARRTRAGGRKPTCDCGECRTCQSRDYQRRRRASLA